VITLKDTGESSLNIPVVASFLLNTVFLGFTIRPVIVPPTHPRHDGTWVPRLGF